MSKRLSEKGPHRYLIRSGTSGYGRTPAGVWVIVAMAVFFVITGLGISGYIIAKALAEKRRADRSEESGAAVNSSTSPGAGANHSSEPATGQSIPSSAGLSSTSAALTQPADIREDERTRREVLVRVDLMPLLSNNDKDKLYAQVERAERFQKVAVVPFAENSILAATTEIDSVVKQLKTPLVQSVISDPTAVIIVAGYADRKGDETKNIEISRQRAENVVKNLKLKLELPNVFHAVGLGGQTLFDPVSAKKNCVAEIWIAVP